MPGYARRGEASEKGVTWRPPTKKLVVEDWSPEAERLAVLEEAQRGRGVVRGGGRGGCEVEAVQRREALPHRHSHQPSAVSYQPCRISRVTSAVSHQLMD